MLNENTSVKNLSVCSSLAQGLRKEEWWYCLLILHVFGFDKCKTGCVILVLVIAIFFCTFYLWILNEVLSDHSDRGLPIQKIILKFYFLFIAVNLMKLCCQVGSFIAILRKRVLSMFVEF